MAGVQQVLPFLPQTSLSEQLWILISAQISIVTKDFCIHMFLYLLFMHKSVVPKGLCEKLDYTFWVIQAVSRQKSSGRFTFDLVWKEKTQDSFVLIVWNGSKRIFIKFRWKKWGLGFSIQRSLQCLMKVSSTTTRYWITSGPSPGGICFKPCSQSPWLFVQERRINLNITITFRQFFKYYYRSRCGFIYFHSLHTEVRFELYFLESFQ